MHGTITLISSNYAPVFGKMLEPLEIEFDDMPILGESFLFYSEKLGRCHTSMVQCIDSEKNNYVLQTKNSYYKVEIQPEAKHGK